MWMDMGSGIKATTSQTYCHIARGASVFQRDSQGNGNAGNAYGLDLLGTPRNTSCLIDMILCPRSTVHTTTSRPGCGNVRAQDRQTKIALVRTWTIGNPGMHNTIFCSCLWSNCSVQAHGSPGYVQDPDKTSKNEKQKSFHLALAMPQLGGQIKPKQSYNKMGRN